MALNEMQKRFVAAYIAEPNATQAAIKAGYSKKTAASQGERLLRHVEISRAVKTGLEAVLTKAGLKAADVIEAIRRPIHGDIRNLFYADGSLKPITELSADDAAMIAGFEVIIKNAVAGDGITDTIHKVKLVDRAKYVEMGAKHFKLLTDVVQHTTDDERMAKLLAGRKRASKAAK